jgi:hypothetical protein
MSGHDDTCCRMLVFGTQNSTGELYTEWGSLPRHLDVQGQSPITYLKSADSSICWYLRALGCAENSGSMILS